MNFRSVWRRTLFTLSKKVMAPTSSPFSKIVVNAMRKIYPEKLADSSFDNTGFLLEAPYKPGLKHNVLLTIDLTQAVATEAIEKKCSIIIAYHPIIFKGLKSLTLANTQQTSLLRLAQEGISVYSPHTAVDAAPGGLNDWLADIITSGSSTSTATSRPEAPPSQAVTRTAITPILSPPLGFSTAGYGRILTFPSAIPLGQILTSLTVGLHSSSPLHLAIPQSIPHSSARDIPISTIGICAGSGGSLLNGLGVDLLVTGELSHHEALAATEAGRCVVMAFHSNTERGFLKDVMKDTLREGIMGELIAMLAREESVFDVGHENVHVLVSEVDRDPYQTLTVGS